VGILNGLRTSFNLSRKLRESSSTCADLNSGLSTRRWAPCGALSATLRTSRRVAEEKINEQGFIERERVREDVLEGAEIGRNHLVLLRAARSLTAHT
jgi:hypothetical protein